MHALALEEGLMNLSVRPHADIRRRGVFFFITLANQRGNETLRLISAWYSSEMAGVRRCQQRSGVEWSGVGV